MIFDYAMRLLLKGVKVRSDGWTNPNLYLFLKGESQSHVMLIDAATGSKRNYTMTRQEILDTKWKIFENPTVYYTFKEVCDGVKSGRKYRLPIWSENYTAMRSPKGTNIVCMSDNGEYVSISIDEMLSDKWVEVK